MHRKVSYRFVYNNEKAKNSTLGDWYEETYAVIKNYRTVYGVVNYVYLC